MQSLINQITNLFATQSLNSLDNSELSGGSSVGLGFGGVLESFSGENNTANIAVLGGNPMPSTNKPISFEITQFSLTAQPGMTEGTTEYNGQIVSAKGNANLLDPSGVNNLDAYAIQNPAIESAFSNNNFEQVSVARQFLDNGQKTTTSVVQSLNDKGVSALSGTSVVTKERSSSYQVLNQNQQAININAVNSVDSNPALKSYNESTTIDSVIRNTVNVAVKDEFLGDKINNALIKNDVIKDNLLVSNAVTTVKPLNQALSAYSVSTMVESQAKTPVQSAALPIDNKTLIGNELNATVKGSPDVSAALLGENLVDKPVTSDGKLDNKATALDYQKVGSSVQANQIVTPDIQLDSLDDLPIEKLEVISVKQTYNPLQQDEIKRLDINARNEVTNIRSSVLNQEATTDNFNRSVNRNEVGIDLSSVIKNQDPLQDVKFSANNVTIDKASIHSPILPDQLSISNKVTSLDRPPLLLDAGNKVSNGDDIAQQIAWAKHTNTQNIKIAISPEHLGALEINIENDADGLNIQFVTQNATAKDALETFMPRLKDMLEQNGLNLQNANVSQQDKGQSGETGYNDSDHFVTKSKSDEQFDVGGGSEPSVTSDKSNSRLLEAFA